MSHATRTRRSIVKRKDLLSNAVYTYVRTYIRQRMMEYLHSSFQVLNTFSLRSFIDPLHTDDVFFAIHDFYIAEYFFT